jgi:hypothetical protein
VRRNETDEPCRAWKLTSTSFINFLVYSVEARPRVKWYRQQKSNERETRNEKRETRNASSTRNRQTSGITCTKDPKQPLSFFQKWPPHKRSTSPGSLPPDLLAEVCPKLLPGLCRSWSATNTAFQQVKCFQRCKEASVHKSCRDYAMRNFDHARAVT